MLHPKVPARRRGGAAEVPARVRGGRAGDPLTYHLARSPRCRTVQAERRTREGGAAGSVRVGGLRISGLSGIYNGKHHRWDHFENTADAVDARQEIDLKTGIAFSRLLTRGLRDAAHEAAGARSQRRPDERGCILCEKRF